MASGVSEEAHANLQPPQGDCLLCEREKLSSGQEMLWYVDIVPQ